MSVEKIVIERNCVYCNRAVKVEVPKDGYDKWKSGSLIQNAMPEVSIDDREMLMSGLCITCWNRLFR